MNRRFRYRRGICAAAIILGIAGAAPRQLGQELSDQEHLDRIGRRSKVNESVDRGLAYLAAQQDVTLGHFKGQMPNTYTALACMALMASGHFPGRSGYGDNLRRGIMYLVGVSRDNKGYFGNEGIARMYGQGICTLALCEAYGMMQDEEDNRKIKEAVGPALKVILDAQCKAPGSAHGGWRYEPRPGEADLSVTAWQVLALRSAQNCRLDVPAQAVEDARNYIRRAYNPNERGFTYQPGVGISAAMRSAGIVCMLAAGANRDEADRKMVDSAADGLLTLDLRGGNWFYYQSYYVATAANMMGGKYRETVLPRIEKTLMDLQQPNGEFSKHSGHDGGVYSTSFAVICLCVGYQYLPIYQE